jgi:hypothetical protein
LNIVRFRASSTGVPLPAAANQHPGPKYGDLRDIKHVIVMM